MSEYPLRDAARGQDCTLRLFPYCDWDPEKTVLAHLPTDQNGMALKQGEDFMGVHACDTCHAILDGRKRVDDISREEILSCAIKALARTQRRLIEMGKIKVEGLWP